MNKEFEPEMPEDEKNRRRKWRADLELSEMMDALISGIISETQFEKLAQRLKDDSNAREIYLAELEVESALHGMNASQHPVMVLPSTALQSTSTIWTGLRTPFGLVAIALAVVFFLQNWGSLDQVDQAGVARVNQDDKGCPESGVVSTDATVEDRVFARITNGRNLKWKTAKDLSVGSWLKAHQYELIAGELEVTFDSGTVVHIAAGSVFEIIDSNAVGLICGSLEADVPEQAIGFKVQTPSGEITDLSTEFGVSVSKKGESDIHVIKGLVEAVPVAASKTLLTISENSAVRMFPNAPPERVEFSPIQKFEFGSRNTATSLNYLHFSFDDQSVVDGKIKNNGQGGQGLGGQIMKGWGPNSWIQVDGPFNKALYLSGKGAKIKTPIDGIAGNQPRTLVFWVRIMPDTPLKNAYSFVSWGHPRERGQKWQMGWNPDFPKFDDASLNGVKGAVRTEFGSGYVIGSTDLRDGKWHHVASVFLGQDQGTEVSSLIRHYVDGKLEEVSGSKEMKIETESNHRALSIGNYIGTGHKIFKGYKGWIDEFYLFDQALTPSQIVKIMKDNQPPNSGKIVRRDAK